jgi:hypothetical protein
VCDYLSEQEGEVLRDQIRITNCGEMRQVLIQLKRTMLGYGGRRQTASA